MATSPHAYTLSETGTETSITSVMPEFGGIVDSPSLAGGDRSRIHHTPQPARPSFEMKSVRKVQNAWNEREGQVSSFTFCFSGSRPRSCSCSFEVMLGCWVWGDSILNCINQCPRSRGSRSLV